MSELVKRRCTPCRGGVPPLTGAALDELHRAVPFWKIVQEHHLEKSFLFPDFAAALAFVMRVGGLAEQEGHHPNICLAWGQVDVTIYTHKIDGLSENDFILAAKIDELFFPSP